MALRSPPAVSPSDELAIDFRDALEDLRENNKQAIGNLTTIAGENSEHAELLSNEVVTHIRKVGLCHQLGLCDV